MVLMRNSIKIFAFLFCLSLLFSCSHQKSNIGQCPDLRKSQKQQSFKWTKVNQSKKNARFVLQHKRQRSTEIVQSRTTKRESVRQFKTAIKELKSEKFTATQLERPSTSIHSVPKNELLIQDTLSSEDCDVIKTYDKREIRCIVKDIKDAEVIYVPCDDPEGEVMSLSRVEIRLIAYSDGRVSVVDRNLGSKAKGTQPTNTETGQPASDEDIQKSNDGDPDKQAMLAFVAGITGYIFTIVPALLMIPFIGILGLVCWVIAMVFGKKAIRAKDRMKKKSSLTLATVGRILGLIGVGLNLLALVIGLILVIALFASL